MTDLRLAATAAVPSTDTHVVPVTPMQRRLLLQHRLFPADGSFNLIYAFRIKGALDIPLLAQSIRHVVHACIGLNASFEDAAGGPVAVLRDHGVGPTLREVPEHPDAEAEEAAVVRWLSARSDEPMAADQWPLYNVSIHLGRHATYLTILSSHLVADAYTFFNVIEMVEKLYAEPESWHHFAHQLRYHPALTMRHAPSMEDSGVPAFSKLLSEVSALGHEALAVDRAGQGVLQGVHSSLELPAKLADDLRNGALIRRHGPFAVFLASYAVVLARFTGRRDVVVGVPLANRRGVVQRQAFGYFVNTLPMPLDLAQHETFEDLVTAVASRTFTLLRHQQFDLAAHAEAVFGRPQTGPVAVDNVFTYYRQRLAPDFAGCDVHPLAIPRKLIKYPFGMNVENRDDSYVLNLEYLPRLSPADPAACVLHVLRTVAANPSVRLDTLGVLAPDRERALVRLAGAPRDCDTPTSLDDWFRAIAADRSAATAVTDPDGETSYADLDAEADRVARNLRDLTSSPHVAIAMRRGRHLVSVILGTLRAGKSYVPIDPAAPPERVRHIVAQFDDLMLVAEPGLLPDIDCVRRVRTADVLSDRGAPALDEPGKDLRSQVAYVIFTSGSTGVPKGVEVTHDNVMRLFRSAEDHFDFGPQDTWCLFHSYAFDFSVWEIFGALLYGGRLVIVPELTVRSPEAFAQLLVRERVTVLNQTPSAFRRLTSVLGTSADLSVRWVVFGGEALHFDVLRPWLESQPRSARFVNMYGITETTVHVTFFEVDPETVGLERESVIGRPLGDLTVAVVDLDLNRNPLGVPGELLVSGRGLALGYRNRPDLTAERFLRGTPYGEIVYRTGDLGYLRPDGALVYLGRIDKQVQLRGYRIELGEVEAGLLAVPRVRECVVRLDEQPGMEPRLVAYVVGDAPSDTEIRAELVRRLPSYMIPAVFVRLTGIPLSVNGKVAEHLLSRAVGIPVAAEPDSSDELARAVARVWAETVQTGPVGVQDNFFDIGGTSMHVAEVHQRLTAELGARNLAMVELFEFPTPAALADRIRPHLSRQEEAPEVPGPRPRIMRPARPDRTTRRRRGADPATDIREDAS